MISVRVYDPENDAEALRACVIELQEYERGYAPGMPPGPEMVGPYVALMMKRCELFRGTIFLAETEDRVVGLASVWGRVTSDEPDDDPSAYAYLSDIVVLSGYRGRGVGRALMQTAEGYARECGMSVLRVRMLARNGGARTFYAKHGFGEVELEMAKPLA
jgi:GNAT superfamily N-acetyltransferase